MGIGAKAMAVPLAVAVVAAGFFWLQWQDLRDDVATLQRNNATLEESLKSTNARMEQALATIEKQRQRREQLHEEIDKLQTARSAALRKIDALRAQEHSRALESPFVRGSAAAERLSGIMQSIQRAARTGDTDRPSGSAAVSSPSADATGAGEDPAANPDAR